MFRILKINLILFTIISCISCSQIVKNENDEKQISDVSESSSKSYLRISIDDATARTILPKTANIEDFDTLILKGMHNSLSEQLGTWSNCLELQNATIEIDSGLWEFELIAKKNTLVYSAKINKQVQNGENTAHFSLSLANLGEGTGSFEIILSYGDAPNAHDVKLVKFSLQNIDGTELSDYDSELFPNNNTVSYFADNISTGNYRICLTFYGDTKKNLKLADYSEIVLVASGIESTASRELNSLNEIYHLTYNLNDDEENPAFLSEAQETYTRYSSFELPIPTRTGYNFAGWWTNNDFEEEVERIDYTKDNEVYALWVKGIPVKASNITDVVSNLKESCELNVVGTISNEDLKSIGIALNNLEEDILVDIDLSLAKSLTSIGDYAFGDCSKLKTVILPNNITRIGNSAFRFSRNLESIIIPESVSNIGIDAFRGCTSLTEIIVPDNVISIAQGAFQECSNLKTVALPDNLRNLGIMVFMDCGNLKEINISKNIAYIGQDTFLNCSNLESIYIPGNVKTIGQRAFYACEKLSEIILSEGLETIGEASFGECKNLRSITIPKTVNSIKNMAFTSCEKLATIGISSECTFGYDPFISTNITTVNYLGNLSDWCKSSLTTHFLNRTKLYINGEQLPENLVIPADVENISDYAFYGCTEIKTVIIPDTVVSIGGYAFKSTGIESLVIPDNVVSIGAGAFACTKIKSVKLNENITTVSSSCFNSCSELETIEFGSKIVDIQRAAFAYCTKLKIVRIPESVMSIGIQAFYGCENLRDAYFGYHGIWYYSYSDGKQEKGTKYDLIVTDLKKSSYHYFRK